MDNRSFKDVAKGFVRKYRILFILAAVLILPLSSWVVGVEFLNPEMAPLYVNHIGFPSNWLTVYSLETNRSVWSLLFEGNKGISIGLLGLFSTFISIFISGFILLKIVEYGFKGIKWLIVKRMG